MQTFVDKKRKKAKLKRQQCVYDSSEPLREVDYFLGY